MNSKKKGNVYENSISKLISLSLSNNQFKNLIYRTPNSGGLATISKIKSEDYSDLRSHPQNCIYDNIVNKFFNNFIIECKSYKSLELNKLCYENKNCLIKKWIDKALIESKLNEKYFLLICKENSNESILICQENIANLISKFYGTLYVNSFLYLNNYYYIYDLKLFLKELSNLSVTELFFNEI